jgi:small subunit ribosomal protein S8
MAMVTDPVADMLARIKNANTAFHERVDVPASRLKKEIAKLLKAEGFIKNYELVTGEPRDVIRITLKYGQNRERVINGLQRISKPGLRIYSPKGEIPKAKRNGCGGEVMAFVW